jgi:PAS domain S-box-containing protein
MAESNPIADAVDRGAPRTRPLEVLLLDDSEDDGVFIAAALRRGGIHARVQRVDRAEDLRRGLAGAPDVLLVDYAVPGFDAVETIRLASTLRPDVPVIIVSGTIGEETAVATMRAGAEDYLLKDRLERLGLAITQALERRRLARDRMRAEHTARTLLHTIEATHQAVAMLDPVGSIHFANPAFAALVGQTRESLVGRLLAELLGGPAVIGLLDAAREGGRVTSEEVSVLRQDGAPFWCRITMERIPGPEVDRGRVVVFVTDTTERRRYEERLRRRRRLESLGRLAGEIAHDFNNLLFVINSHAERLQHDDLPPERIVEAISAIRACGERGSSLTAELLLFARSELVPPVPIAIGSTLRTVLASLAPTLPPGVALESEIVSEPSDVVLLGAGLLERVITNLVLNARDAMPAGGVIHVHSTRSALDRPLETACGELQPGTYAVISVADTGTGMSRATMDRIFEPFFTTKGVDRGNGLGLSTAHGIVAQCGGSIDVTSVVAGDARPDGADGAARQAACGSVFTLYLPLQQSVRTVVGSAPVAADLRGLQVSP